MSLRVLTGIKPTGVPHLGNYVGAIRPAVAAASAAGTESFFFLADYHALISTQDPLRVQRSTLEIAASWIACGLDPDTVAFYRQSDVPETTELTWLLTCVAGKGLLNRAHAYKAAVDRNRAEGVDDDAGVTAGLYMYPVLMAADILLFNAHRVPVGRDQVQHIEMARDFAQRFNHIYGEHFTLPEALVEEQVATLPGLDGRKMSKSYDNVIPLFAPRDELRRLVFSIVTDSRAPGEPKATAGSALFQLYQAFADRDEAEAMRAAFAGGIAWGEAKARLFERIDAELAPLRERYQALVADPAGLERLLRRGGERLRDEQARPFLARLRDAVGLRDLSLATRVEAGADTSKPALPVFKQYREADGRFHFKLVDGDRLLLQGDGFASPRDAGRIVGLLKSGAAAPRVDANRRMWLDDAAVGAVAEGVDVDDVLGALERFAGESG
ncbi:tryptophan--tRNA ligase [Luteimonas sp. MC1782]|nr:tryptophan--tRNA ligase [Luteimonas sp. MC1895]MBJ6978879.1 tryptophan--tRNA ligase [Luteimonas sp. MC1895]